MGKYIAIILLWGYALLTGAQELSTIAELVPLGPRMAAAAVQGATLKGQAPHGQGEPFRILNGSTEIWKGKAGEDFNIAVQGGYLYFISDKAANLAWQNLTWKGKCAAPEQEETSFIDAAENGLTPGMAPCGKKLREIIDKARKVSRLSNKEGCTISLAQGDYHFYEEDGLPMSLYISNHDQQTDSNAPVAIPLVNLKGITLEGNGSHFIFHGKVLPLLILDTEAVTCRNIRLSYATPIDIEGKISRMDQGAMEISLPPEARWEVQDGIFHILSGQQQLPVDHVLSFEESGIMTPSGQQGDIPLQGKAIAVDSRTIRYPATPATRGLHVGNTLVLRSYARPFPAVLLSRSRDTELDKVTIHDSMGMGVLAQRCQNVTIKGGGCIRAKGRMHTVAADATHFSNCRGLIRVENALFEGMMDDAINVHATCLRLEAIPSKNEIIVRYMHPQAIGLDLFQPNERLRFIHSKTLENEETTARVTICEWLYKPGEGKEIDATLCKLTLSEPVPPGIGKGDAVENADWHPSVEFTGNTVRHNRARGALFTTPRPVRVNNCRFDHSHGSAILLAGDAQGWYESGSCQDVEISHNTFDHNLTARYQFTEGIISIYPEIKEPEKQKQRYHRNIRIQDNRFHTHRVPLLFAQSAENITFSGNDILWDNRYPAINGGKKHILRYCDKLTWTNNIEHHRGKPEKYLWISSHPLPRSRPNGLTKMQTLLE